MPPSYLLLSDSCFWTLTPITFAGRWGDSSTGYCWKSSRWNKSHHGQTDEYLGLVDFFWGQCDGGVRCKRACGTERDEGHCRWGRFGRPNFDCNHWVSCWQCNASIPHSLSLLYKVSYSMEYANSFLRVGHIENWLTHSTRLSHWAQAFCSKTKYNVIFSICVYLPGLLLLRVTFCFIKILEHMLIFIFWMDMCWWQTEMLSIETSKAAQNIMDALLGRMPQWCKRSHISHFFV